MCGSKILGFILIILLNYCVLLNFPGLIGYYESDVILEAKHDKILEI